MLINETINRVQSAYSKGMPSDDSRLSNRHIYSKLKSSRIRVISQQLSKKQIVNQWCYQSIVIKLTSVPIHECANISSDTCKVLRSETPIPQIFTNMDMHLIQSVTSIDGSQEFGITTWEDLRYKKGRKYTQDIPEYFLKNGYIYITNKKVLDVVLITALFNDPIEAKIYSNLCGEEYTSCLSYLDYDFAIDGKLEDVIIDMTVNEFLYNFSQTRDDRQNNASDDIAVPQRRYNQNQRSQDTNE